MGKLKTAFSLMRDQGLVAKQNYMCCQSCGIAAITEEGFKDADQGKEVLGFVFYHGQDTERRKSTGDLYLSYGQIKDDTRKHGVNTTEVGKIVCECLDRAGLGYEWDGDPKMRIGVGVDKPSRKRRKQPKALRSLSKAERQAALDEIGDGDIGLVCVHVNQAGYSEVDAEDDDDLLDPDD